MWTEDDNVLTIDKFSHNIELLCSCNCLRREI